MYSIFTNIYNIDFGQNIYIDSDKNIIMDSLFNGNHMHLTLFLFSLFNDGEIDLLTSTFLKCHLLITTLIRVTACINIFNKNN